MNQERVREIQVGIMVVVAIAILVGGLMFFKRVSFDTNLTPYAADFDAVEGLRKGDRVQLRGIRVGAVSDFEILPGRVRVHMELEDWVQLRESTAVVLVLKGIVGEVLIEIEPGDGAVVQPGHVFEGRNAASMLALGDRVNMALDGMTALSRDMRSLLAEIRADSLVTGPLEAAQRTMTAAEDLITENREPLREITRSMSRLAVLLEDALGEGRLDTTLVAAREAAESITVTMDDLYATGQTVKDLLARLERGEGTAGRLLTDESLYDQADSTLQSIERLTDELRRNPKTMLKASLF